MDQPPKTIASDSLKQKIESFMASASDNNNLTESFINVWNSFKTEYAEMAPRVKKYLQTELNVPLTIEHRLKTDDSVRKSILRRMETRKERLEESYESLADILKDVHDLLGFRIIVDYGQHLKHVNKAIKEMFAADKNPNRFPASREVGYQWTPWFGAYECENHHVSIKSGIREDLEPYCGVMFEVQVTCLAESLYNRLAHRLLYKSKPGSISRKDEMVIDIAHGVSLCYSMCLLYFEEEEPIQDPDFMSAAKRAGLSSDATDCSDADILDPLVKEVSKIQSRGSHGGVTSSIPLFTRESLASGKTINIQDLLSSLVPPQIQLGSKEEAWKQINKSIRETVKDALQGPLQLPEVPQARFDSNDVAQRDVCHTGTRRSIFKKINDWMNDKKAQNMLWIYAPAGTGKSTLVRSLARQCEDEGTLGAGYFFARGFEFRNGTDRLFSTLASQLAKQVPRFQILLRASCQQCVPLDHIQHRNLKDQFEILIRRPLSRLDDNKLIPKIIIIDGLDEYDTTANPCEVISLLSSLTELKNTTMRVVLASRNVEPIRGTIEDLGQDKYRSLALHEESKSETVEDIRNFLTSQFFKIRKKKKIREPWPLAEDMDLLVQQATTPSPLFIYASTLLRYIDDPKARSNSKVKLQKWIQSSRNNESQLDQVYKPIIDEALEGNDNDDRPTLMKLLTSIACAARPITLGALGALLHIDQDDVNHWLGNLHPVLQVPQEDYFPVTIVHKSFSDFLLREDTKEGNRVRLHPFSVHLQLSFDCIAIIRDLAISGILDRHQPEVSTGGVMKDWLRQFLGRKNCISDSTEYACLYWAHHWLESHCFDHETCCKVLNFFAECFLHWIEVLAFYNQEVRTGLSMIRKLTDTLRNQNFSPHPGLISLLKDAEKFFIESCDIIIWSPWHIRLTSSTFWPLKALYGPRPSFIETTKGNPASWFPQPLQLVDTRHEGKTFSVFSFSKDRRIVAISHGKDFSVRDVETERCLWMSSKLPRHIVALEFSQDAAQIASISENGEIRLWNVQSGLLEKQYALDPPDTSSDPFLYVDMAISWERSLIIASVQVEDCDRKILYAYEFKTGKSRGNLHDLDRGGNRSDHAYGSVALDVWDVALSTDGTIFAALTEELGIQLWTTSTFENFKTISMTKQCEALDVAPTVDWIVGSSQHFLTVFDRETGISHSALLPCNTRCIKFLTEKIVAFTSPLGLVTCDISNLLRTTSGVKQNRLIKSMALSPDLSKLATSSHAQALLIYELESEEILVSLSAKAKPADALAFSTDQSILAALSANQVKLWKIDLHNGSGYVLSTIAIDIPRMYHSQMMELQYVANRIEMCFLESSATTNPMIGFLYQGEKFLLNSQSRVFKKGNWTRNSDSISVTGPWVRYTGVNPSSGGHNILWTPLRYLSQPFACAGKRLVMGNLDGEFAILDFDLAEVKKLLQYFGPIAVPSTISGEKTDYPADEPIWLSRGYHYDSGRDYAEF